MVPHSCLVVIAPDHLAVRAKEVLGAALRGQVVEIAGVLGDLRVRTCVCMGCCNLKKKILKLS